MKNQFMKEFLSLMEQGDYDINSIMIDIIRQIKE